MWGSTVCALVGPLRPLLRKLDALLDGQYGRMRGVRTLIGSLRSELTSMQEAAEDHTTREESDSEEKTWIALLRELAYDTEDCIDKFIHQLGSDRHRNRFREFFSKISRYLKTLGSLQGISDQIDQLKVRVMRVKELSSNTEVDPRLSALFAEEAHLVGIDGPRDHLSKWMLEEDNTNRLKVLSIVGSAGLGKTTLANQVYRQVQERFNCCAFVSVSQKPDMKKIFKDVISQVPCHDGSTNDTDDWDIEMFIIKLRELLRDKRYLIIIDDVWYLLAWETIKYAFPENRCGSRIIITTRNITVAQSCCRHGDESDDYMYKMEALSDLDSRSLFFKRIFPSEGGCCPAVLKEVSDEILKKCEGLPLAIISISGLLANRPVVIEEWEKVKRSIGSALSKTRPLEGMGSTLSLSYNDIPLHLRTCLLYLSIFPENYVIGRERLVRLWIAEGFINEMPGISRQEIAECYFYELINRSMILPVDIGHDGTVRACRVHPMMLAFIISKSSEDNFTTVVGAGLPGLANCNGFIRRLSVQHIDQELASALANEDLSHIRSLIVTTSAGCIKLLPSLVKFGALHVLDFEDCEGLEEYVMNDMDKLFRLKYLRLRGKAISKLPSGTVMLGCLETLDIRNTSVQELPAGIVQLTKLEHLHCAGQTKIPNRVGDMRNLQVISGFNISQSQPDAVEELLNMISLDELKVYLDSGGSEKCKRHEELLFSLLCKLGTCKLRSLWIHKWHGSLEFLDSWSCLPSSLETFGMSGCFMNIPKWTAPTLTSLAYLEISVTELTENLHTLGEISTLLYLKLSFVADPVELITIQGSTGFLSLNNLVVYSVAGVHVKFMEGAMRRLEKLKVRLHVQLAKRYGFYLGIEHLPCFKEAVVNLYRVDVTPSEIMAAAAAAAIRNEASIHPNSPTIDISGEFSEKHSEISNDEEDLR